MQRKMKLIYKLLEYVECHGNGEGLLPPEISGYTDVEVRACLAERKRSRNTLCST